MPSPMSPVSGRSTEGPVDAVPCPWCGGKLDFREFVDDEHGGAGWGSTGELSSGNSATCDHCGRPSKIIAVRRVTLVRLAVVP